jgi:hypothetical protein
VGITFSRISTSSWTIKPWFLTKGKACCYIHHTLLLGFSNWTVIYSASSPLLSESAWHCWLWTGSFRTGQEDHIHPREEEEEEEEEGRTSDEAP